MPFISAAGWATPSPDQGERAYTGDPRSRTGPLRVRRAGQGRRAPPQGPVEGARTWRYTWDADDRLTEVRTPDGQTWRYLYDALGRRIAKERADGTGRVDFVWDVG
nr:RHS repeat domain-containing protein [Nonomuraea diastatica]